MTFPTNPFGNLTGFNSQAALIPHPLIQEDSLEVQTDQISQPIFTMHHADRQASNRVGSSDQEKKTSKDQTSGKRARNDDVVTQGAAKRFRKEEDRGNQNLSISDENSEEGEFKKGMPNGLGKITFSNGNIYEGEFKEGKPSGRGKKTFLNGNIHEGEYKDGRAHGYGKTTFPNGSFYESEFKDGKPHGHGKMISIDGRIYEGEIKDGKPHGRGKHREHREVVRKMRDLVRFLRKYTLIFLSVLSVFSVVKSQRELLAQLLARVLFVTKYLYLFNLLNYR